MKPILSVLMATIPSRFVAFLLLYRELLEQSKDFAVEILALMDNKKRSVGAKRQALLDIANGQYVTYVDDDDEITSNYVSFILESIMDNPDLIVSPIRVTINGERDGIVESSIRYADNPIPEYAPPITYRPPHHLSVWRAEIARKGTFPDIQHGEDFKWAAQCWPYVKNEVRIDKVLYHYKWSKNVTEAEPV